ncbi:hypothetical protein E2K93_01555 [Thalassotalea sp. HSM 43]|uniref:sulfotransferase domain-containing protein n=1 Tax=Thalassotalea sp. HSM 43 TaxID=2552945 RepID=UPI00108183C9|nr:sulfotransferase domain-containing protein [Thalassotalea sp. HSM 43]QBY03133.1 hypothetical protein E2K93_01555 [Thalassotalea sp. HSM 43]
MKKVALHSVPRSGSSWLGEIINSSEAVNYSYQPLFSFKFKSVISEQSSLSEINDFYEKICLSDDNFLTQEEARTNGIKPCFEKKGISHIVYKEVRYHYIIENLLNKDPNQKVIGLVRNPLSVLNSWKSAPREFRTDLNWEFEKEWDKAQLKNLGRKEEYFGYQKWKEVALLFQSLQDRYRDGFLLVKYSDLLNDTQSEVEKIFKFLELELSQQTLSFINRSASIQIDDTYSVFKTKSIVDDNWKNSIPNYVVESVTKDCNSNGLSEFLS